MSEQESLLQRIYDAEYRVFCGCGYWFCSTNKLRGEIQEALEIPYDEKQLNFFKAQEEKRERSIPRSFSTC